MNNLNVLANKLIQSNPMIRNNPIMQNAFNMAQHGDERGLQQLAQNVARSKNIDLNEMIQKIKTEFNI